MIAAIEAEAVATFILTERDFERRIHLKQAAQSPPFRPRGGIVART